jgi:O-antigen/teichoic acid export membrane protein
LTVQESASTRSDARQRRVKSPGAQENEPVQSSDTRSGGLDVGSVLARNTLWNYAGFAVNLAINLALFPFAVRRLGTGPAGVWLLLASVTGYMGLLDLGMVPALMQRIASTLGRGSRTDLDETVSTALALTCGLMLVALQVVWLAPVIGHRLHLPEGLFDQAVAAISLSIAGVALKMPLAPFQAVLLGCQRQDRCNQLWIVLGVTKAIATVFLLLINVGLVGIVAMEAIAHLAAGVLQVRWVRQELPALRLSLRAVSAQEAHALLRFGAQVTLGGISVLIVEQTDKLVIGAFLPIEHVTLYSAAWKLYMLAYSIPTTLIQALSPVLANLHGAGDMERLRAAFYRMTKYSAVLAVPMVATLGLSSGWILRVWMGPAFSEVHRVVAVLVCGLAVTALNHAGYSALLATGQVRRKLWAYDAPQAVLNLALSLWLVRSLGILGVAIGTLVPALLMQPVYLRLLFDSIGVTWLAWSRIAASAVLPALVAFLPPLILRVGLGHDSAIVLLACMLSTVVYLGWFWYRGLDQVERTWALTYLPLARLARLGRPQSTT